MTSRLREIGAAMTDRSILLNAFTPAQEVESPKLFSGRVEQLKEVSDSLRTDKSCPVIYGERGLGKSSLARQAQLIAMGDRELLNSRGLDAYALGNGEQYLAFVLTCSDEIRTFEDLTRRMVNKLRSVGVNRETDETEMLVDRQTRRKISLKAFELEWTKKYGPPPPVPDNATSELDPSERVEREVDRLCDHFGFDRVLIVIDELDRVGSLDGLASFIKSSTGPRLKFMLVGIAESLSDLDLDHPSVERTVWPVEVPRMNRTDLSSIVDNAIERAKVADARFDFAVAGKRRIAQIANGFPWFVHVIGQAALLHVAEQETYQVSKMDVDSVVANLASNRYARRFRDTYQKAVRDSRNREIVLRLAAAWDFNDVPTQPIYSMARTLGVTGPTVYKGHLCSETYGDVLFTPAVQERGLMRFRNEMFKQYVRITPSLYAGVKDLVERTLEEHNRLAHS